jgi:hypothetical protein
MAAPPGRPQTSLADAHHLHVRTVVALQELEQVPGDGSLYAPSDLAWALAIAPAAGGVGARCRVVAQPHQGHGVQRPVELAVTATVQSVTGDLPRGGRDRAHAGQGSKRRLRPQPASMRPAQAPGRR